MVAAVTSIPIPGRQERGVTVSEGSKGAGEEIERRTVSGDDSDLVRRDGRGSHGRERLDDDGAG